MKKETHDDGLMVTHKHCCLGNIYLKKKDNYVQMESCCELKESIVDIRPARQDPEPETCLDCKSRP